MKNFLLIAFIWLLYAVPSHGGSVKKEQRFYHNGMMRLYYLNIPPSLPDNAPLVIALHGMGGQAHKMRYGLGLHALADEMGFATLFPQGGMFGDNTTYWNAGQGPGNHDDLGFLSNLIDYTTQEYGLDPSRVYVLGISNGAQMAYHLACHAPDRIAGIASVIGTLTSDDWSECHQRNPIPLLHIHGVDDPVIPFNGGKSWRSNKSIYPAAPELVARWARDAGAILAKTPKPPTPKVKITYYETPQGVPIELLALLDFGHDWPHPKNVGFSASHFIVSFFMGLPSRAARQETPAPIADPFGCSGNIDHSTIC